MSQYILSDQKEQSVASFMKAVELSPVGLTTTRAKTKLQFTAKAKAKLEYFRDKGSTEVTCFAVTKEPYVISDFIIPKQECTSVEVNIDGIDLDDRYYEYEQIDKEIQPWQYNSIWIHTHPGNSASPSNTDETQFKEFSESLDNDMSDEGAYRMMYILAKGGEEYCRMRIKGCKTNILVNCEVIGDEYSLTDEDKKEIDDAYDKYVQQKVYTVQSNLSWSNSGPYNYGNAKPRYNSSSTGHASNKYGSYWGKPDIEQVPAMLKDAADMLKTICEKFESGSPGLDKEAKELKEIIQQIYYLDDEDVEHAALIRKLNEDYQDAEDQKEEVVIKLPLDFEYGEQENEEEEEETPWYLQDLHDQAEKDLEDEIDRHLQEFADNGSEFFSVGDDVLVEHLEELKMGKIVDVIDDDHCLVDLGTSVLNFHTNDITKG